MSLVTTKDTATLVRLADAVVAADPVRNTIFGAIAYGVQQPDAAGWAAQPAEAPLTLAARSQPYTPVTFTAGWTELDDVTAALAELLPAPAGLAGPSETVEPIAASLGRPVTDRIEERLFRLDELVVPRPVAGTARLAEPADEALLVDWFTAFTVEAFGRLPQGYDAGNVVQRGMARSRFWLWLDARGAPRSFAARHPPVSGVSRIGPVYTPPDSRGRGYGSAATAAASQDTIDDGAVACLFTDLANPTSNKIYRELGYVPVLDRTALHFD